MGSPQSLRLVVWQLYSLMSISRPGEAVCSLTILLCAGHLQDALEWQHLKLSMEEVECLVANLIYRGYVKGYISHAKRVLVLSKMNPFPALDSVSNEEMF